MLNYSTIETLKVMRCSAMASELENQLKDSKTYGTLAFEERVSLIVDAEWNRHQQTKLQKLIKLATFSQPSACIENILHTDNEFDDLPNTDRKKQRKAKLQK